MWALRRILVPAALASFPIQIALVIAFGTRSAFDLLHDPVGDWLETIAFLGGLTSIGHLGVTLPAAAAIRGRAVGQTVKAATMLFAGTVGGGCLVVLLLLPSLFQGGSPVGLFYLSSLGAMSGAIAIAVWLPINLDVLLAVDEA